MGEVRIQTLTTMKPITLIGQQAAICTGADTSDDTKNYKRGLECLDSNHGRTFEFVDVYMEIKGYSSAVIREWYTHIGGSPTRLQSSTRYQSCNDPQDVVIPPSVVYDPVAAQIYSETLHNLFTNINKLQELQIPQEDIRMLYPLGLKTSIVCKHNLRNLIDMSHQRMCKKAYWEYQELFEDLCNALKYYSYEWKIIVKDYFMPKCKYLGYCNEKHSCKEK